MYTLRDLLKLAKAFVEQTPILIITRSCMRNLGKNNKHLTWFAEVIDDELFRGVERQIAWKNKSENVREASLDWTRV